ncbi:2,3,4,5-tetrahydropyridine-2,6-dicarboxylate N-succinyltransferase [soil metagenome]
MNSLREIIDAAWEQRDAPPSAGSREAVAKAIALLTEGKIRAAEPSTSGVWTVNDWVKKAILLFFRYSSNQPIDAGALQFFDKVPVQGDWERKGVRVVPPAIVRIGAHVSAGVILMPSFVNIGAHIGAGTMIDTWATVGSCAQVGANCHISGGVGIGGVLEPLQAAPVIIENNCFIGARSEVAEGVRVREGAVLAMGCYVGAATKIVDAVNGGQILRGEIPPRAVVVPGAIPSPDGSHSTYALIIKKYRDEKTDAKTALNEILR